MKEHMRTYVTIDTQALLENMNAMRAKLKPETKMTAVIKADGYGHGAVFIAKQLEQDLMLYGFAVATAEEAFELRDQHIQKPILILGYTFEEAYDQMIRQQIRMTVFNLETAKIISEHAGALSQKAYIHIKLDTGMGRIGFACTDEALNDLIKIFELPNLIIEGIFTHFARADEKNKECARKQLEIYQKTVVRIEQLTQQIIPMKHCSNSAAIMELKDANMDMVRAGISMYGLWPSEEMERQNITLKPLLEWKSHIVYIKEVEADTPISYGGTYLTKRKTRIATIPVGYGDGYPRSLSNKGYVLINGKQAPILGRVCMDQFMVDVTDIDHVKELDEVTLIGTDHDQCITAEELGDLSGRFNYELVCCINKRVPRIYI
ncbi:MAG: alanine racemase [Clostridia bacterium]|nr:alanine racemase [Clostridia bacterium]